MPLKLWSRMGRRLSREEWARSARPMVDSIAVSRSTLHCCTYRQPCTIVRCIARQASEGTRFRLRNLHSMGRFAARDFLNETSRRSSTVNSPEIWNHGRNATVDPCDRSMWQRPTARCSRCQFRYLSTARSVAAAGASILMTVGLKLILTPVFNVEPIPLHLGLTLGAGAIGTALLFGARYSRRISLQRRRLHR